MALFQHSILNKYINTLDKALVNSKWDVFKSHFLHPDIQENIRNSKEEQYQEGFLRDLFVSVLGYKLNPSADFNLTTEYKNIKDSKKADGAIIIDGKVKAVIELKGNDTTDLSKIEPQAFGYKNNQPDCKYIIISNFEKLRFYIENTVNFIEFNLFKLTETDFQLLWLCLSFESIATDVPATIKHASADKEENITKELYKDYSLFKSELYQNLVKLNPYYNDLELFKKSQKLLDRFLFILFAEDRDLLPNNSIRIILDDWNKLKELDEYKPLYSRYIKYFGYLNIGFKGKQTEIFAYNGGLFKPDEILDNVLIDDELLYKHTHKLSTYDFESEVDVNILGHIFENSLNEIDEIKAQLEGQQIDKTQTKRKKDGVFYTPKYITKYIVENTVGKLCAEKKAEIGIDEQEYTSEKKKNKDTKQKLLVKLTNYRDWLLHITIVDPACGSGAFLNEALNFLISEHTYIDELETKITGGSLVFPNIENSILENNLFGVDLNEESVEIARLSLWLRTAKPNRKLNDLSANIKCGNSLIDDPEVAGDKAFSWQKEFPQVFVPKQKKIWHVTTATHNSRYSQRMFDNHVKLGEAEWIDTADELIITQTVAEIAKADALNILQYNLCGDHLHLLIVCEEEELPGIVGKIKSVTAKNRNRARGYTTMTTPERGDKRGGMPPRQSPRFEDSPCLDTPPRLPSSSSSFSLDFDTSPAPKSTRGETQYALWTQKYGCTEVDNEEYLRNVMEYIRTNRVKHQLPANAEMEKIIKTFLCTEEYALRTEYKGGFDVVIGNPPYGAKIDKNQIQYVSDRYSNWGISASLNDTYFIFYAMSLQKLLKPNGFLGFITPNTWKLIESAKLFRKNLLNSNYQIIEIIQHLNKVFADATVDCDSLIIKKKNTNDETHIIFLNDSIIKDEHFINQDILANQDYINLFLTKNDYNLIAKINKKAVLVKDVFIVKNGVKPYEKGKGKPAQTDWTMKEKPFTSEVKKDDSFSPLIGGSYFNRYQILWNRNYWIQYGEWLAAPRDKEIFDAKEKLIFRQTSDTIIGSYLEKKYIIRDNTHILLNHKDSNFNLKYILSLLNSKLVNWCYWTINPERGETMAQVKAFHLGLLPIIALNEIDQQPFIEKADLMLGLNKELQEVSGKFQRNVMREFGLAVLSGKLQNWFELSYSDFLKELAKAKVSLSLGQKAEWEDYFIAEQQQATALQTRIHITDKEIDAMVYQLYGLTNEEVKIVEGEG